MTDVRPGRKERVASIHNHEVVEIRIKDSGG